MICKRHNIRLLSAICPFLFASLFVLPFAGCMLTRPTLHAAWVSDVPKPNGMIEQGWNIAPPLYLMVHRGSGHTAEKRPVQLQAIYDDRAICIMARWPDHSESVFRRQWAWNDKIEDYQLELQPVDQFAIMWPMSKNASFNMLDGKAATYHIWQWRAAWSDLSGFADNRRLVLKPHPKGTRPETCSGPLYPLPHGKKWIEFLWRDKSGIRGTRETPKPITQIKRLMPGGEAQDAPESSSDIYVSGVYSPMLHPENREQTTWKMDPQGDFWFVKFYRHLLTKDKAWDYQLRGSGPHYFAIAVFDNESGADHFVSGPIRLILGKPSRKMMNDE